LNVKGIDINVKSVYSDTALHLAAKYQLEVVPLLLNVEGIDVNVKTMSGWTALQYAAKYQPESAAMIENYLHPELESEPEEIVLEISEHDDIKTILKELLADTDRIIIININK
jgi:ankyrin repeat protein